MTMQVLRKGPLTAVAVVLMLGACSTIEDGWDYVFGGDSGPATVEAAPTAAAAAADADGQAPEPAEIPTGLRGDPNAPDYTTATPRRQPTSPQALDGTQQRRQSVAESFTPAAAPAAAPVIAAPVEPLAPAPAPAPAAVTSAPSVPVVPLEPAPTPMLAQAPEPLLMSPPIGHTLVAPPAFGGGYDDLGTTVIGGDGRVIQEPAPMGMAMAHLGGGMAAPGAFFDTVGTQVATIQFGHGSAGLSGEDRQILRQVAEIHRRHGGILRVVGHSSSRTADMSLERHRQVNYTTSVRRAEAVAAELRRLGVPGHAIDMVALADSHPLYREVMPSGEAGNRRTEIYLIN